MPERGFWQLHRCTVYNRCCWLANVFILSVSVKRSNKFGCYGEQALNKEQCLSVMNVADPSLGALITADKLRLALSDCRKHPATKSCSSVSSSFTTCVYTPQSCPWVGLSCGLGRVGNGCEIFVSSGLGLVIWVWNGRSAKYASRVCMKLCIGYRQANLFCILIHYPYGGAIVRYMGVQLGMGWIGSWVHKFTRQWAGLGRVSYLVGWLGLGRWKQTHGQLCYISATFTCFSPFGSVVRTSIKF